MIIWFAGNHRTGWRQTTNQRQKMWPTNCQSFVVGTRTAGTRGLAMTCYLGLQELKPWWNIMIARLQTAHTNNKTWKEGIVCLETNKREDRSRLSEEDGPQRTRKRRGISSFSARQVSLPYLFTSLSATSAYLENSYGRLRSSCMWLGSWLWPERAGIVEVRLYSNVAVLTSQTPLLNERS